MNKVTVGLVFLALGVWGSISWWWFIWDIIKGVAVLILLIAGLLLIGLGVKNIGEPVPAPARSRPRKDNEASPE